MAMSWYCSWTMASSACSLTVTSQPYACGNINFTQSCSGLIFCEVVLPRSCNMRSPQEVTAQSTGMKLWCLPVRRPGRVSWPGQRLAGGTQR